MGLLIRYGVVGEIQEAEALVGYDSIKKDTNKLTRQRTIETKFLQGGALGKEGRKPHDTFFTKRDVPESECSERGESAARGDYRSPTIWLD